MQLTFFDLDNTLLAGDSDYEWGRYLVDEGLVDPVRYRQANEYYRAQYEAGTLDIHDYQRFVIAPMIEHSAAYLAEVRRRFVAERIVPIIAPHTEAVLTFHRRRGDTIALITATNAFITQPIAALLGIDHLIATEPALREGVYTGEIDGTPSYQEGKIVRAKAFIAERADRFEAVTFYSDSHNDLPLLRWSDYPVAVDPDATLAAAAEQAGWPIISLRGASAPNGI